TRYSIARPNARATRCPCGESVWSAATTASSALCSLRCSSSAGIRSLVSTPTAIEIACDRDPAVDLASCLWVVVRCERGSSVRASADRYRLHRVEDSGLLGGQRQLVGVPRVERSQHRAGNSYVGEDDRDVAAGELFWVTRGNRDEGAGSRIRAQRAVP